MRQRERVLITSEGWVLTQDDPNEHAVGHVFIQVGGIEVLFVYETTLIEADEHGRRVERAIYREADEVDERGG